MKGDVTLYVTQWVVARGILVLTGTKPEKRPRDVYFRSYIRGSQRRINIVFIGVNAFYTLAEAREDALRRMETHYKKLSREYSHMCGAMELLRKGRKINVHRNPASISKCKAFT